uniref:Cupin type-1 domain-containing protein n=1 Tax=Chenopodium quinoa TaxID=63459 RepID=A0A803MFJ7_CHEQI
MGLLKGKVSVILLVFSLLVVLCASLSVSKEDQQLRLCKEHCRQQRQLDSRQRHQCETACEEYIREKERREQRDEPQSRHDPGKEVMIFEANPQTFVVPNHWDADVVLFVAQGEGTVSLVYTDRRESFNIERGHVMVIPAGVTAYLINKGNNDKLILVKLINPVSNIGKFESFFGPGGDNPESYFNAFSSDILEAAFKTSEDSLKRIFSQQREGAIIRASEEQIKALTHEKGSHWPFGGKGSRDSAPFHLLRQNPRESNDFGSLFEVDSNDYRQLRDLNVAVSFANITQGSMHTPYYNSRATKIAVVLNGKGYFEMACPHINSELREGTVFVVPPSHPFVTVASEDENLEVICFEINAENNHKFPLAGQRNILKNIEKEAKELAFATSAEEVDEVFRNQEEEFFFKGPRQQEHRRGYSII